tara:strand:- start:300 stop:749 length:450 start_codon:yes stop_codon:yes gene_type:complete
VAHPDNDIRDVLWQLAFQFKLSTKAAIADDNLPLNGMHVRLLRLIRTQPDCTANQLANLTRRDKAQITRVLKELDGMGLIQRAPHPDDKRSQIISLSAPGRALMRKAEHAQEKVKTTLLKGLSQTEIDAFLATARRMIDNLDREQGGQS